MTLDVKYAGQRIRYAQIRAYPASEQIHTKYTTKYTTNKLALRGTDRGRSTAENGVSYRMDVPVYTYLRPSTFDLPTVGVCACLSISVSCRRGHPRASLGDLRGARICTRVMITPSDLYARDVSP